MAEQGSVGFEFCVSCGEGTLLDYGLCSPDGIDEKINGLWPDRGLKILVPDIVIYDAETTLVVSPASPDCETGE